MWHDPLERPDIVKGDGHSLTAMHDAAGLRGHFEAGLSLDPDRVALRVGTTALTYPQLRDTAVRWANTLCKAAYRPVTSVGVLAARGVHAYVGVVAALYASASIVPLHPDLPVDRTRTMIDAAGVNALIVDGKGAALLDQLGRVVDGIPVLQVDGDSPTPGTLLPNPDLTDVPMPTTKLTDVAYVLFTSGSTGRPKGVPITHANVNHYLRTVQDRYRFGPDDVFSQTFELTFDLAMFDMFATWGAGACLVCVPPIALTGLSDYLTRRGVTVWFSVPSVIALLRRTGQLTPDALPTLRWSLFCGEPLSHRDATDWYRAASGSTVENLYGPTELTISVSVHRWNPGEAARAVNGIVPIGTVHRGHDTLLLGESGQPSPTEGELCVTGAQMTSGYLDERDNTGRFIDWVGRRWYRTGDVVRRLPNGTMAYLGRTDHQVKIRGQRLELTAIDWAVLQSPGIDWAASVVVQVGGEAELYVFYTGRARSRAEFVAELSSRLSRTEMPKFFEQLDELPLIANRKIDRTALAALARERVEAGGDRPDPTEAV